MKRFVAVLFALVPLAVFPFIELPYEPPKVALFATIAALACFHVGWLIITGKFSRKDVRLSRADVAVLIFLAVLALSTFFSVDPLASLMGSSERHTSLAYYACATAVYLYVRWLFGAGEWRLSLRSSAVVAGMVSAYACLQEAGIDFAPLKQAFPLFGVTGPERAFSTFGHPNFLGAYLAAVLPFAAYLVLRDARVWRWIAGLAFVLGAFATFFTYSRADWLALGAGLVVTAWVAWPRVRTWMFRAGSAAVIVFFLLWSSFGRTIPAAEQNRNPLAYRFASTFDLTRGSTLARLNEWDYARGLILQRPLLGYGLDTYIIYSPRRVKDVNESAPDYRGYDPSVADRIHNVELDVLWSGGIAALLAFLYLAWTAGALAFRPSADRAWTAAAAGSVAAYFVSMQFGFDFSVSFPWFLIAMAALQTPAPWEYAARRNG